MPVVQRRPLPVPRPTLRMTRSLAGALAIAGCLTSHVRAQRPSSAAAPPGDPAAALDAFAARAVRDWHVPGLALAVVKDGRIVLAKGYGVRRLGAAAAVDTATLFAIGSTTKAMTSAAIEMLADEKKLSLDDPATRYLPDFQLSDPYITRQLTIRDLLTHRAGVGNADVLWYRTDITTDEVLRRMRFAPIAYSMRSGFVYQNIMYAAAGRVVQRASGVPWDRFISTRIFAPAGMTSAVTSLAAAEASGDVATPHARVGDTVRAIANASVDLVAPAGAVWASVADMARWVRVVLDSTRTGATRLLSPRAYTEWLTPQTMVPPSEFYPTAKLTHPHWTTYALGWFQEDYAGRMVDFHTGSIDGMVAIVGLVPEARLGVVVLANLDHAEVRHALMYEAFDLWLGNPPRDWNSELRDLYGKARAQADSARAREDARRIAGTKPSLPLSHYAGVYADSLVGDVRVVEQNGALRLTMGAQHGGRLEHWQYDTFRLHWDNAWEGTDDVTFTIGPDGRAMRMDFAGTQLTRRN